MSTVFFRTIILYALLVIGMRVMGKRQMGELSATELVIAILISDLAAVPMQDTGIPLLHGIIPIITLVCLEILISFIALQFPSLRNLISGNPCYIIKEGKINQKLMSKLRFSLDDLLEEMRLNGYKSIDEVDYVIIETSGKISIFPKSFAEIVTAKDLNIKKENKLIPETIISDGILFNKALNNVNKNKKWVIKKLKEKGIDDIKKVFFMSADNNENVIIIRKD